MDATVDGELVAMMNAVFATHRTERAASPVGAQWDPRLWCRLDELGLARLTGSEASGGSGGDWHESAALLRAAATQGVSVPVVEHDLLAGWLLEQAELPMDTRLRTACTLDATGTAHAVPWAHEAARVVVLWAQGRNWALADVAAAGLVITPGRNVAGEPRDTVRADVSRLQATAVPASLAEALFLRGALARTLQVCGALEKVLELCITHTRGRTQFGRPLATFQAVQALVADAAAETSLARTATEAALTEAVGGDWSSEALRFAIAVAKSCAGHATSVVVRNAHQVHGAIGTTAEHELHEYTKPALAWRSEFGSVHYWDEWLTRVAVAGGRAGAWAMVSGSAANT